MKMIFRKILSFLPHTLAHKILYFIYFKKNLNLKRPKDINEKIQWLILNRYGKKEAELADKLYVKEIIEKKNIKELYVPKILKIYSNENEIDIKELPNRFVLKCTHCSGNVFICTDKSTFDIKEVKKALGKALKKDFSYLQLEYHYSLIKPKIIAEEYLNDGNNKNPIDYKFYCFNGVVSSVLVCTERDKKLCLNDFDREWNELDYTFEKYRNNRTIEKPKKLVQMIKIAEKLSENIDFVRIDLYEINNKIYFGEYTFTPAGGLITYYKQSTLNYLGNLLEINDNHLRKEVL